MWNGCTAPVRRSTTLRQSELARRSPETGANGGARARLFEKQRLFEQGHNSRRNDRNLRRDRGRSAAGLSKLAVQPLGVI